MVKESCGKREDKKNLLQLFLVISSLFLVVLNFVVIILPTSADFTEGYIIRYNMDLVDLLNFKNSLHIHNFILMQYIK